MSSDLKEERDPSARRMHPFNPCLPNAMRFSQRYELEGGPEHARTPAVAKAVYHPPMPDNQAVISTYEDVVNAIRTLMETFSPESQGARLPPEVLLSDLDKLETHERRFTNYVLVVVATASIRVLAMAFDRDEFDVLAEVARSVGVAI
jgi:hypothetical protein